MLLLKTFGGLSVDVDGTPGTGAGQQRKTLALLALLAAAGRRGVSRDKLAAFLWPESDTEHARSLLKQACYALRRDLHAPELFLGATELRLNPAVITSDIQAFEHAVEGGDPERAAVVYAGPFLDGFYLGAAGEFERWMEDERSRLARQGLEAVELLANQASSAGEVKAAVKWWRRLTELDPLSAQAALGLMRALDDAGERAEAVQHGRRYEAYVRQELGVEPAAAVVALIQELHHPTGAGARRSPARAVIVEPSSVEPAHGPLRSGRLGWRAALAAAVIVLVGGMVAVARSRKPAVLDPELIAVAPFDVYDPRLELWHEGLVDLLSRNLDGAGAFRTVAPTVVIRRWRGLADRASAEGLGRRTGAGIIVFGQLLRVGPDSVRLRAAVLDARTGRTRAEIDRANPADRIDRLADSVSVDVIRTLTASTPGLHIRLFSVGTRSLPALKAFLQGERFFRNLALDSAIASYDRAIAIDTTFALALRRAGLARGWNLKLGAPYFARAGLFNHGLGPRDSLLVSSDSVDIQVQLPLNARLVLRKISILEEAARRYPEDPEVWYQLGETRFHIGSAGGYAWRDARAAFDRAIILDSTFGPAYVHPVEIALNDNDPDAAMRYVRAYLSIATVLHEGGAMRLLGELLDPERFQPEALARALETASPTTLYRLAFAVRSWPDPNESQIAVAKRILAAAQAHPLGAAADADLELRVYRTLLANVLLFRGHVHEARRLGADRFEGPFFMDLAVLGEISPDSVDMILARWIQQRDAELLLYLPWFAAGPCHRTMDAAAWWASRRDTARVYRLLRREDAAARTAHRFAPSPARPVPEFVRSALALARGDTSSALKGFLAFPDSLCPNAQQLRDVRFRLLVAVGRGPEAAALFDRSDDRRVPLMLERARLAERLGDRPMAVHYFRFVLQAWLHADPERQPVVAEAQSALQRLGDVP